MVRRFEVGFYWEEWVADERTEKTKHSEQFECDVPETISFNGQGVFGIVSTAFLAAEADRRRGRRATGVTGVRELEQAADGHWF